MVSICLFCFVRLLSPSGTVFGIVVSQFRSFVYTFSVTVVLSTGRLIPGIIDDISSAGMLGWSSTYGTAKTGVRRKPTCSVS